MKELFNSVHIWQRYRKNISGSFLWPTVYYGKPSSTATSSRFGYGYFGTVGQDVLPSHTRAATVRRPYCDQFFDQIALDRSKVSLRSHYGPNVVAVGRTSRRMVVLVVLVAVRNFGMFKILYCDFSIAVQSVCCLSACARTARTAVAVRSPNAALHSHTALTIGSHDCTATMRSQIVCMNCNVVTQPKKT